ncbi:MAG: ATP-binding protein [Clostridia bacterium]|nr:ATP-binding protein [Clostridia bacterium]MBQ3222196.1 ATP-binding protein [Clostridia bacterium]
MNELALYILDLTQNSVTAGASCVEISVTLDREADTLVILIKDDGCGMSKEFVAKVTSPFTTTRKTRKVGLGIPMIKQLCEMCEGTFRIESELGKGTTLHLEFQLSHVDLPPMGDLAETMTALVIGSPDKPDFRLVYSEGAEPYVFDTAMIRQVLGEDVPLNTPEVVLWMQDDLREGLAQAATPVQ